MKKIVKISTFIIIMLCVMLFHNTVNAANVTIDCSSEAEVGTITISANVNAAQWNLSLKVNGTEIANSSELENFESNIQKKFSGTYNATTPGDVTITCSYIC